jgi:hypothetical protein
VLDIIGIGLITPYVALVVTPEVVIESEIYNILIEFGLFSNVNGAILLLSIILVLFL